MDGDLDKFNAELRKRHMSIIQDDGLILIKLDRTKSDLSDPVVRHAKGVILDAITLKLVAPFVQIPLDVDDDDVLASLSSSGIQSVSPAYDGTLIRVYNHNGEWKFSTTGMIYPDRGWGGNRTFADMFSELDETIDYAALDESSCYYYMMRHPGNYNVVKHSSPELVLVRTINCNTLEIVDVDIDVDVSDVSDSLESITSIIRKIDLCHKPGPILVGEVGLMVKDNDGNMYRFETDCYKEANEIKMNQPDPRYRYLELRNDQDQIDTYLTFFPDQKDAFDLMQKKFNDLATCLFNQYINHYAKRNKVVFHSRHVSFIKEIHELYLQRYSCGECDPRISKNDVASLLNEQEVRRLFYLINPNNVPSSSYSHMPKARARASARST